MSYENILTNDASNFCQSSGYFDVLGKHQHEISLAHLANGYGKSTGIYIYIILPFRSHLFNYHMKGFVRQLGMKHFYSIQIFISVVYFDIGHHH